MSGGRVDASERQRPQQPSFPLPHRPEIVEIREIAVRYFHRRASLDDVKAVVLDASKSMRADSLSMEEILVVLKGGVTLAVEHVNQTSVPETAVALRAQMAPWLISIYMNDSGEFGEPVEL